MQNTVQFSPFQLGPSWERVLAEELTQDYLVDLAAFVEAERASGIAIYPPDHLVFNAFKKTAFEDVKVLIVGQDPYHGPGQAHGLSFSVAKDVPQPPSLKNIFKELKEDLGIEPPSHGSLVAWADQGVMLLNATLTVAAKTPLSHHGKGWERFTDAVVRALVLRAEPCVFVLWGKNAQEKCQQIPEFADASHHLVLKARHPSPFSAHSGFFGSRPFSKINAFLKEPIDWRL